MLCLHASRIPASAQYITEPMKTREIRTGLAIVRHINTRVSLARGTNTTVTPCRCTSGRPYCRLGIPTPCRPPARAHAHKRARTLGHAAEPPSRKTPGAGVARAASTAGKSGPRSRGPRPHVAPEFRRSPPEDARRAPRTSYLESASTVTYRSGIERNEST